MCLTQITGGEGVRPDGVGPIRHRPAALPKNLWIQSVADRGRLAPFARVRSNPRRERGEICRKKCGGGFRIRTRHKLTARRVETLRKRGRYGDGGGLWLEVAPGGTRSWIFRFSRHGRARHMGLGSAHTLSLADAREAARACHKLLLEGKDPIEVRRHERERTRLAVARTMTFQQCSELYLEGHSRAWKNAKHANQWRATLQSYVYPQIGALSVGVIDTALVLKVVEPIWHEKPETANRVRGRIESVLDWASVRDYRSGDNPARWRGHLQKYLAPREKLAPVKHHPALPYAELPAFIGDI
jgi:hypothetical protein